MLLREISVHDGTAWNTDCDSNLFTIIITPTQAFCPWRGNFGPWHSSTFATHHPFFVRVRIWFPMKLLDRAVVKGLVLA